jgi:hypothetical protein
VLWTVLAGGLITTAARLGRIRRALEQRKPRADLLSETYVDVPTDHVVEEEMLNAVCR